MMNRRKAVNCIETKRQISSMRKAYLLKLFGRCIVLLFCGWLCLVKPSAFDILQGTAFFERFSVLHFLWLVWMADMALQMVYVNGHVPLGSQKLFRQRYLPVEGQFDGHQLRRYISAETRAAYKIFLLWTMLTVILGCLKYAELINDMILFLISVFFYVCDLICVLIWCPFRVYMKNRCCTTCRIFNWDHLMMFSPLLFVDGFYGRSLFIMAAAIWLLWEYSVMAYPERFWEHANAALQCVNCVDKLCSHRCGKQK